MTADGKTIHLMPSASKKIPHYFIEKIVHQDCIWGLRHPEGGWALCPSNHNVDRDVYLFWSERRRAYSSVHHEWAEFVPVAIELCEFIPTWLEDMIARETRVGLDWVTGTEGTEYDALSLKKRICQRLSKQKHII